MSNQYVGKRNVKGFTLTELIVVIAIIGILLGILMPSMMNYYRRSKIQTANSDAKMVFNASQTMVQRYMSIDRTLPTASRSGLSGIVKIASENGALSNATGSNNIGENDANAAVCTDIGDYVNRNVSGADSICWAVYVQHYIVKGAVAASNATTPHVGFYSANKQVAAMDSPRTSFSSSVDSRLADLASGFDTASPTEAATEATT